MRGRERKFISAIFASYWLLVASNIVRIASSPFLSSLPFLLARFLSIYVLDYKKAMLSFLLLPFPLLLPLSSCSCCPSFQFLVLIVLITLFLSTPLTIHFQQVHWGKKQCYTLIASWERPEKGQKERHRAEEEKKRVGEDEKKRVEKE